MYIITLITSFGFKDFNFLILPKINGIGNIKKTIIFIDSVKKGKALAIYYKLFY